MSRRTRKQIDEDDIATIIMGIQFLMRRRKQISADDIIRCRALPRETVNRLWDRAITQYAKSVGMVTQIEGEAIDADWLRIEG